jgi:RimJ/RimL family protein N-acetyltransferase
VPQIPLPDPPLADEAIVLRPWRADDLAELVAAVHDPEVGRWTTIPFPYTERDGRQYLGRIESDRLAGRELGLAATEPGNGRLLGGFGLSALDWQHRKGEIGYWVAAGARRRSVGTRAVRLLSRWALTALGLERVELLVNPENEASQRLALRAGFTREGVLRGYRLRKGRREDLVMFSLLRADP